MTALKKYDRLESPGLWRDTPEAQRREVIVGLRDATLVMSDPKSDMALSQWSLPAVRRVNAGVLPALYSPDDTGFEMLELDDPDMIAALETLHGVLERRRPHPGRLRSSLTLAASVAVVALAVLWLPDALVRYTAKMLPTPTRSDLGLAALTDLERLSGQACTSPAGNAALAELSIRLFPDAPPKIAFLREAITRPYVLPGGMIVLPAVLLESSDGPDALAGHILSAALANETPDPVEGFLSYAGLVATLQLLTTGAMGEAPARGYAEVLLTALPPNPPALEAQVAAFQAANVAISPFAYDLDITGTTTRTLIEAEPFPLGSPVQVLADDKWLALQAICLG